MGFPEKWIAWTKECLSTPTFSVLLNGSPTGFFTTNRGVRQGDPLSPYIFVLVMEFWSIQMDVALASGRIESIRRDVHNFVTHLLFADDLLVFLKANKLSLLTLCTLLEELKLNTGLIINIQKSKIYLSKGCSWREELKAIIGLPEGLLPTRYLGMPLSEKFLKHRHFSSLIDKCKEKLEGWRSHTLSFPGRIELIRSVIHGIVFYWI